MDLDPSLAFTAILEMWPDAPAGTSGRLAAAMTRANPMDRWAFAKSWITGERQAFEGAVVSWSGDREQAMTELQEMGLSTVSARGVLALCDVGGVADLGCGQTMRAAWKPGDTKTTTFEIRGEYQSQAGQMTAGGGCSDCGWSES